MTRMANPTTSLSFLRSAPVQRRVLAFTVGCAVLGGFWGLLGPKWYRSTLTVVPATTQKSSGIASLLGGDLGSLAAGLGASVGGGTEVPRIGAVLQSTGVSDAVVDKFDLKTRYDEKYQEKARDELWKHCEVRTLTKPGLVQISCEDRDPAFAQAMLSYFADYGNQVFRRVSTGTASEEVRYLEKRVVDLRKETDESATRMREFQEKHQIVDMDSQARAVVSSVALLNSQRIAKQMELDYAQRFSSPDEASSRQLRSQLSVVDEQLREMELPAGSLPGAPAAAPGSKRKGTGLFPAALEVPALRAEFEKLYRDRKVAEATLIFALDRLESARAAKARDVSTFAVLDPATLPTRKSRPGTMESTLVGALLGMALGVALEWRRARRDGEGATS